MIRRRHARDGFLWTILEPRRSPRIYFLFALLLGLLIGLGSDALQQTLGVGSALAMVAAVFLGVAVAVIWRERSTRLREVPVVQTGQGLIAPKKGLITLVSFGDVERLPATSAIRHHFRGERDERTVPTLQYVWLLSTPKPKQAELTSGSAYSNAKLLEERYGRLGVQVDILEVEDANDPEEVFRVAQVAYARARQRQLRPPELVADVTGGTISMTVGLTLAAALAEQSLEYLKPRKIDATGRPVHSEGSDPRQFNVSFIVPADQ